MYVFDVPSARNCNPEYITVPQTVVVYHSKLNEQLMRALLLEPL